MQPPTAGPRGNLTAAQVVGLIQDAPSLTVSAGCELVDTALNVLDDLTDDLSGGKVTRASYATLHGSATLTVSRQLDWGRALVRPYIVLSDGTVTARFNLGAYYTSTPKTDLSETPRRWAVAGYDVLHGLTSPVGEVYAVDAGVSYLAAVEAILIGQGFTTYLIDQSAVATVLPSARVWPLDERTTWLGIANDLLAAVGYQGIWSDWDGRLRCQQYENPRQRNPEWVYDTDNTTSMITARRTIERDFFAAPNRWVAVRSNNIDSTPPVEGNGVYTYVNQRRGDTSVDARGGRVITRFLRIDAADQASLVAAAQQAIDADLRVKTTIAAGTAPNPLHWHFDRLFVVDPAAGAPMDVLGTTWSLPLDGTDMTHEWSVL